LPFYRIQDGVLILTVRVQPGARADAVVGEHAGVLRVRLRAPAVDGRANEALRAFLAARLGTAKSCIEILKGASSRIKSVAVRRHRYPPESLIFPGKNHA